MPIVPAPFTDSGSVSAGAGAQITVATYNVEGIQNWRLVMKNTGGNALNNTNEGDGDIEGSLDMVSWITVATTFRALAAGALATYEDIDNTYRFLRVRAQSASGTSLELKFHAVPYPQSAGL